MLKHACSLNLHALMRACVACCTVVFCFGASDSSGQVATSDIDDPGPQYSILEVTDPNPVKDPANSDANKKVHSVDAGESIDRILTKLALDAIPHTYTEDKNWGKQDERWDGIDWSRDGLRLKTRRKKKKVNHGTWRKYSAELIDPADEFSVQLKNLHKLDDGKTGFDVHITANLKIHARQSKWVKGVQLYSFSAEGDTQVRLVVSCELGVSMNITKFPPDLIFEPNVTNADLTVEEFRLDRISKAGGEVAQQATRAARKVLDKKIKEKERKLVDKLNGQLEKKKDKLKISVNDAIKSKFATQATSFLPETVQQAMSDSR